MKTLVLLRHAETENAYSGQKDFDRELTNIGISDAIYKGKILKDKNITFDLLLVSSAKRAAKTAELIAEQIGYTIKTIKQKEEIYLASTRTMLSEINMIESKYSSVLLVAHNPGTEFIAEYLTGESIGHVPPAGAISIELDVDSWEEVSQNFGKLLWKDFTKS